MGRIEKLIGGHFSIGNVTVYGMNGMHFAVNVWTKKWGYVCFRPTTYHFGRWHRWYFYVSPNATPWASTFAIGPGLSDSEKALSHMRRLIFGHRFDVDLANEQLTAINNIESKVKNNEQN